MGQVIDLIGKQVMFYPFPSYSGAPPVLRRTRDKSRPADLRTQSEGAQWVNRHAAGNRDSGSLNEQVVIVFQLC